MEYYIVLTNKCNMHCKYCVAHKIHYTTEIDHNDIVTSRDIAAYIQENAKNLSETHRIVFYGGEPLLKQQRIIEIIEHTASLNPEYILYTNGLLLDELSPIIRDSVSRIFVSFDGLKNVHDIYRSADSYDRIKNNILEFKRDYKGTLIGRITFVPESDIFEAVRNSLRLFDCVFWQQASLSNGHKAADAKRYHDGIDKLIRYWIDSMEKGRVLNILPFQAITGTLLLKEVINSFRCGCGTYLRVINWNGDVFICDEMIRNSYGQIGSIYRREEETPIAVDRVERCEHCDVKHICGGRCLYAHKFYSAEQNNYYCLNTRYLIYRLLEESSKIQKLITEGRIASDDIVTHDAMEVTEQIP